MFKKNKLTIPLLICMVILGCSNLQLAHSKQTYQASGQIINFNSADWGQIQLNGGYILLNNVWNKGAARGSYQQKIFEETIDGKPAIGWQWQWPSSSCVVAYPEVIYGDKPWDEPKGLVADLLPFRAGSSDLTANFDISINASGVYNMAFSLWAITDPSAPKKSITHEIMIWNLNNGWTSGGKKNKVPLEVNGAVFDFYLSRNWEDGSGVHSNKWTYIAFVSRTPILKGPLEFGVFIDYLLDKGILTEDHYITSVELGNEVVKGAGITEIKDYSISIQKKQQAVLF